MRVGSVLLAPQAAITTDDTASPVLVPSLLPIPQSIS